MVRAASRRRGRGYSMTGRTDRPGCMAYLFWMFLSAVLLYAAAQVLGRTEGARALAVDALNERLGMECSLGSMRPAWNLALVLDHVHATDPGMPAQAVWEARRMRVSWRPAWNRPGKAWLRDLDVRDARLHLAQDARGSWHPQSLAGKVWQVAAWLGVTLDPGWPVPDFDSGTWPAGIWRGNALELGWTDGTGYEQSVSIGPWMLESARLADHPLLLVRAEIGPVRPREDPAAESTRHETILTEHSRLPLSPR